MARVSFHHSILGNDTHIIAIILTERPPFDANCYLTGITGIETGRAFLGRNRDAIGEGVVIVRDQHAVVSRAKWIVGEIVGPEKLVGAWLANDARIS
jgi:hypothetical protein